MQCNQVEVHQAVEVVVVVVAEEADKVEEAEAALKVVAVMDAVAAAEAVAEKEGAEAHKQAVDLALVLPVAMHTILLIAPVLLMQINSP